MKHIIFFPILISATTSILILIAPVTFPSISQKPLQNGSDTLGDVDSNNVVDIGDSLKILQFLSGIRNSLVEPAAADLDGNGAINIMDALQIRQILANLKNVSKEKQYSRLKGEIPYDIRVNVENVPGFPTENIIEIYLDGKSFSIAAYDIEISYNSLDVKLKEIVNIEPDNVIVNHVKEDNRIFVNYVHVNNTVSSESPILTIKVIKTSNTQSEINIIPVSVYDKNAIPMFTENKVLFMNQSYDVSINLVSPTPTLISTTTPTPTLTVTPTSTPTITPTPTPTQGAEFLFNESVPQLNQNAPSGFNEGNVRYGKIPEDERSSGQGISIDLLPGQGIFMTSNEPVMIDGLAHISGLFKSVSKEIFLALVALNSPVDGQIAYVNITGDDLPLENYEDVDLFYDPPNDRIQFAIQAVNLTDAFQSATVWVDEIRIRQFQGDIGDRVKLQVKGDFNSELDKLLVNLNNATGIVEPFFKTFSDIGLKLKVDSQNTFANFATTISNDEFEFPNFQLASVNAFRDPGVTSGTLAFVLTNGNQNMGLFRNVGDLPIFGSDIQSESLQIGGRFESMNPDQDILMILQNSTIDNPSTLIVDDLKANDLE